MILATLAADEINESGGVNVGDKKMLIEVIKHGSHEFLNFTEAINAMQRAVNKDDVDFLLDGFRTEAVLAKQDIAADYKKYF